jgi:soluble lytic murein transglycosylase-like protein
VEGVLLLWLHLCCAKYGVEPEFALRVARVESGAPGQKIRVGRLGKSKYFGPMGIHEYALKKWPVDDPFVNIRVGVRALAKHLKSTGSKRGALKKYNPEATPEYLLAVLGRKGE